MDTMWTPMCGQSWIGGAVSFLGMWTAMMAAIWVAVIATGLFLTGRAVGHAWGV